MIIRYKFFPIIICFHLFVRGDSIVVHTQHYPRCALWLAKRVSLITHNNKCGDEHFHKEKEKKKNEKVAWNYISEIISLNYVDRFLWWNKNQTNMMRRMSRIDSIKSLYFAVIGNSWDAKLINRRDVNYKGITAWGHGKKDLFISEPIHMHYRF